MRRINECFICGSNWFSILKKYRFKYPKKEVYDKSLNILEYNYERLKIFFEKIWKNKKYADFDIKLCQKCGIIFTNPRFTPEEIKIKYSTISELKSERIYFKKKPALRSIARAKRIFKILMGLQKKYKKSLKILDYGGGRGHNLLPFIQSGNPSYLIDYVRYDHPMGIEYLGQDLDCLKETDIFDIILLCHTLEHSTTPKELIIRLSSHLTQSGLLYVEVPLGCWQEWKYLQEPLSHVNFFSEESLSKCLNKSGLKIAHLSTAFQWFTHGNIWCLNIVGTKSRVETNMKFSGTLQQMNNHFYHIKTILDDLKNLVIEPRDHISQLLNLLKKILSARFRSLI